MGLTTDHAHREWLGRRLFPPSRCTTRGVLPGQVTDRVGQDLLIGSGLHLPARVMGCDLGPVDLRALAILLYAVLRQRGIPTCVD